MLHARVKNRTTNVFYKTNVSYEKIIIIIVIDIHICIYNHVDKPQVSIESQFKKINVKILTISIRHKQTYDKNHIQLNHLISECNISTLFLKVRCRCFHCCFSNQRHCHRFVACAPNGVASRCVLGPLHWRPPH